MGNIISGIFGGGPDNSAIERENKRLREEQLREKRSLAQEKSSRRRRIARSRGALQFASTGAQGLTDKLGGGGAPT